MSEGLEVKCGCIKCLDAGWEPDPSRGCDGMIRPSRRRMVVCRICGNKRCPHATDHIFICTQSNEPGQAPKCGSYEVRYSDGRQSKYFYYDDIAGRRLRPQQVDSVTALEQEKEFARVEREGLTE